MNKKILFRLINITFLAAIALILTFLWVRSGEQDISNPIGQSLTPVTSDAFGGPFSLTNHHGERVTEESWPARYRLMYFGFTYCPAICPTDLQRMTQALNLLGEQAQAVQPLFITVDPERDTVDVMKNYVSLFHPQLIGLTGSEEDIANVLKDYKIYAAKVDDPEMTEYTMDHSTFTYLIAPDGRLLHIFKMEDSAAFMAEKIQQWLLFEQVR